MKKKQKTKTNQTQTQQQTIAPSSFAQPHITGAADALKPAYEEGMATARQYQPGLLAANDYYRNTLLGDYLDAGPAFEESPYLEGVIGSTNRDITDAVNSSFMPRFGSGYHAKTLARAIADNESNLRYGDAVRRDNLRQDAFTRERGYQDAAGRNMAGLATTATLLPSIPSQTYAQGVGGLLGRYVDSSGRGTLNGTQTTTSSPGLLDIVGMGLQGASLFSDARLKTDIRRIGQTDGGLPVYTYRYGGDGPFFMGPLAHEVAEMQPEAMGPDVEGYHTVFYEDLH